MSRTKRDDMPSLHLSPLEEDLLTILNGHELYSIQIERILQKECGRKQDFGSIYPTLRNLLKRGFLSARWGEETPDVPGGPRRRYYTLIGLGARALEEAEKRRHRLKNWTKDWTLAPEGG